MGLAPALTMNMLGDPSFCKTYGTRYAYCAGAMANGISSEEMVIALGKAGLMGSFGAGGVSPSRIETAIQKIKAALPKGHMPSTCSTVRTNRCWKQGWLSST
jgi:trans-AT polyketide synthase/acyltransferase/oxidoreductase domain-containing protein